MQLIIAEKMPPGKSPSLVKFFVKFFHLYFIFMEIFLQKYNLLSFNFFFFK